MRKQFYLLVSYALVSKSIDDHVPAARIQNNYKTEIV